MAGSWYTRMRAISQEIIDFAKFEAGDSRLPGQDQGPGDAYRHLIGVAELSRRLGPTTTLLIAEGNELRSFVDMLDAAVRGKPIGNSDTAAARAMDRHNNALALAIGANADSTEQVVMRVRAVMERAIASDGGSGAGNTPMWQASRYWSDGGSLPDWSPESWSDLPASDHFARYRAGVAASGRPERASTAGGGSVQVSPYMRDGHSVSGHTRSAPAR
jgi:hypothetical protein